MRVTHTFSPTTAQRHVHCIRFQEGLIIAQYTTDKCNKDIAPTISLPLYFSISCSLSLSHALYLSPSILISVPVFIALPLTIYLYFYILPSIISVCNACP